MRGDDPDVDGSRFESQFLCPLSGEQPMRTLEFRSESRSLRLIDQTRLPHAVEYVNCGSWQDVAQAIREMRVRGAPAIGVAAAYGLALAALSYGGDDRDGFELELDRALEGLAKARPTAVTLFWALDQGRAVVKAHARSGVSGCRQALLAFAQRLADEDVATCRAIGQVGSELVPRDARILTHCNTGALAAVDYGTALGVVRAASEAGKRPHVYVDETRPFLQGARLTTWELQQAGISQTLITDSMAGHFMSRGAIDLVIVGADRVAANGDVANKIGTYTLAVLCREHEIPFYVAAPLSTVDFSISGGSEIPIEERPGDEVVRVGTQRLAPEGVKAANPAFDVTPSRYVTAIITERGIARAPYGESLARLARDERPAAVSDQGDKLESAAAAARTVRVSN
jgi:methylthioribose-1-phosphate isomerase